MSDMLLQQCRSLVDRCFSIRREITTLEDAARSANRQARSEGRFSNDAIAHAYIKAKYDELSAISRKLAPMLAELGIDPNSVRNFATNPENAKARLDALQKRIVLENANIKTPEAVAAQAGAKPDLVFKDPPKYRRKLTKPLISPSQLKQFADNPISWMTNQYLAAGSSYRGFQVNSAEVGTEIHAALEAGFEHLKKIKNENPHADVKARADQIIRDAENIARGKLILDSAKSRDTLAFVREKLQRIGGQFLANADDQLATEVDVESHSIHSRYRVGGRIDLLYYNSITKSLEPIDWKNYYQHEAEKLTPEAARNAPATKIYSVAVAEQGKKLFSLTDDSVKNIRMIYEVNTRVNLASGASISPTSGASKTVAIDVTQDDIRQWRTDLSTDVEALDNLHMRAEMDVLSKGTGAVKELIADLMKSGRCSPSKDGCARCPAAYVCPTSMVFSTIADAVRANQEAVSVLADKYDPALAKERTAEHLVDKLKEHHDAQLKRAYDQYLASFKNRGMSQSEAESHAKTQFDALQASYKYQRDLVRSQDVTGSYLAGSADKPLPFSIFDETFRPHWMDKSLKYSLRSFMRDHIASFSESINFEHPNVITDELIDRLGRSKSFQSELYGSIAEAASGYLRESGIDLSKLDVNDPQARTLITKAMRTYSRTLTTSALSVVQKHLDRGVTEHVMNHHGELIKKHLSPEELKTLSKERDIEQIAGRLREATGFDEDLDKRRIDMTSGRNYDSLLSKFRLSKTVRFPFAAGLATFALTYLASAMSVHNTFGDKFRKAMYATSADDEVDDGTHAGAIQTSMRLLSSDFGSAWRPFLNVSSIVAGVKTWGSGIIGAMKDAMSMGAAHVRAAKYAGAADVVHDAAGGEGRDIAALKSKALKIMGISTGIGLMVGIAPSVIGSNKYSESRAGERSKRVEKARMNRWGTGQTQRFAASSDMRRQTKLDSPFGSPIVDLARGAWRLFRSMTTIGADTFVNELSAGVRYDNLVTRSAGANLARELSAERSAAASVHALNPEKRAVLGTMRGGAAWDHARYPGARIAESRAANARLASDLTASVESSVAEDALKRKAAALSGYGHEGLETVVQRRSSGGPTQYVHPNAEHAPKPQTIVTTKRHTPVPMPTGVPLARRSVDETAMPVMHSSRSSGRMKPYMGPMPASSGGFVRQLPAAPTGSRGRTTATELAALPRIRPAAHAPAAVLAVPDAGHADPELQMALMRVNRIGFTRSKTPNYQQTPIFGGR